MRQLPRESHETAYTLRTLHTLFQHLWALGSRWGLRLRSGHEKRPQKPPTSKFHTFARRTSNFHRIFRTWNIKLKVGHHLLFFFGSFRTNFSNGNSFFWFLVRRQRLYWLMRSETGFQAGGVQLTLFCNVFINSRVWHTLPQPHNFFPDVSIYFHFFFISTAITVQTRVG